ncbi:hypothetical protein GCM10027597_01430 [Saccharopolyspora tripterygii]
MTMADSKLGRRVVGANTGGTREGSVVVPSVSPVVTRTSLWPERWPAIALQSCIDTVEAAPVEQQSEVRRNLPCDTCPENARCLNAKRKEIGPLLFDREIQTAPRAAESSLFPRDLMAPMLDADAECLPHYRKPFGVEDRYVVVSGWDLAWSEKVGGDYLVRVTALADRRTGHMRLLDLHRERGLRYTQQCELIAADHYRYSTDLVVIEGDAAQTIWRQNLEETTSVPVISHHVVGSKKDLHVGVPGMLIDFSNRRWTLPHRTGGRGYDAVETLLDEFEAFGWQDDKLEGSGEHDDTVMAFWHCWWGLRLMLGGAGSETYRGIQTGRA